MQPMSPTEAKQRFLNKHESEYARQTLQEYGYSLDRFIEYLNEEGITNTNRITGRTISDFSEHRKQSVKDATVKTDLDRVRRLMQFCEDIDAVAEGIANKISSPKLSGDTESRDERIEQEAAGEILEYMEEVEYGTLRHVAFLLVYRTGFRSGTLLALDVDDFVEDPRMGWELHVQHRPSSGTPLKNKERGERIVSLKDETAEVLNHWLEYRRPPTTDDNGREPLLATAQGRLSKSALRRNFYVMTRPCWYTHECPHGVQELTECEAYSSHGASKCPSSRSPHAGRRGAIQKFLDNDADLEDVSGRSNVTREVLKKHYDTKEQKELQQRRRRSLDKF